MDSSKCLVEVGLWPEIVGGEENWRRALSRFSGFQLRRPLISL
jgi:hypothetical protein